MKTRYILPAVLAVLVGFVYFSDPVQSPEPEVRHAIKLTIRHLPIHRYFADEDEDDSLAVSQQYMIVRRDISLKAQIDILPTEDDIVISKEMQIRLMLARIKALNKYNEIHGVDQV